MKNLRKKLEEFEAIFGEQIEAITIGSQNARYHPNRSLASDEGVVLSRENGLNKLDYESEDGYLIGADVRSFFAWTKSRVFFVYEYDSHIDINYVPRHPIAIESNFNGIDPEMERLNRGE